MPNLSDYNTPGKVWGREPAVVLGLVQATIALAIGFGLGWTTEQVALVVAFTGAFLGFVTRSRVTPYHPENEK